MLNEESPILEIAKIIDESNFEESFDCFLEGLGSVTRSQVALFTHSVNDSIISFDDLGSVGFNSNEIKSQNRRPTVTE